jgi:hypothetical protein
MTMPETARIDVPMYRNGNYFEGEMYRTEPMCTDFGSFGTVQVYRNHVPMYRNVPKRTDARLARCTETYRRGIYTPFGSVHKVGSKYRYTGFGFLRDWND